MRAPFLVKRVRRLYRMVSHCKESAGITSFIFYDDCMEDISSLWIRRRASLLEADVSGELVALHVDSGTCYGFNRTATRIWELLEEPHSVPELCDLLAEEFSVDRSICERDVIELARELERDQLVEINGPGFAR